MGTLFGVERRAGDSGTEFGLHQWQQWLDGFGWSRSTAGVFVTHDTAMAIAAVYASVRIIAETIGSLPITLYRRLPDGSKAEAIDDPLYWVLRQPNDESTQMHMMQTTTGHAALRGNGYAQLIRDGKGRAKEIWPIHPDRVQVQRKRNMLVYQVFPDGLYGASQDYTVLGQDPKTQYLFSDDMLHLRLLSVNGVTGMSPIQFARNNFGLALAQEEYAAKLYSNGAMPRGLLCPDEDLDEQEREDLRENWKRLHQGVWNAHKTAIMPKGVKWQQLAMTAEDAQYLATRKFQIAEIARIFRVPLHLLQDLERSTNNNIAQQSLEFLIHTIRPWLENWEQTINFQVLTQVQREKGLFVEFNADALLRCDPNTQAGIDDKYIKNGVYSVNEIRLKRGDNPVEGGDDHYFALNMGPLGAQGVDPETETPADVEDIADESGLSDGSETITKPKKTDKKPSKQTKKLSKNSAEISQERARKAFRQLIWADIQGFQRKEAAIISKQARKLRPAEFEKWLDEFVPTARTELAERLRESLTVAAQGLSDHPNALTQVKKRAVVISEAYAAGIKADVQLLIERSAADGATSWPQFLVLLESSEIERARKRIAEQIATDEIEAILALEVDDVDAA